MNEPTPDQSDPQNNAQRQLEASQLATSMSPQCQSVSQGIQIPDIRITVRIPYNLDGELSLMAGLAHLTELFTDLDEPTRMRVGAWYLDRQITTRDSDGQPT